MAANNIFPRLETKGETSAGTSTITEDYTVTTNKRWLIGAIVVKFGTAASDNTVDIQHPTGTDIWEPQLVNFTKQQVDPTSKYPRAVELESADVLRIVFTRGTSSTVQSWIYIIEADI